jgi:hypothetical protein
MTAKNENELVLDAIQKLSQKLDRISETVCGGRCSDSNMDRETLIAIAAATYNTFGKRTSIRSVRLIK